MIRKERLGHPQTVLVVGLALFALSMVMLNSKLYQTSSPDQEEWLLPKEKSARTFPVGKCPLGNDPEFIYPVPEGVEKSEVWRYSSKGLYWQKCDNLFWKFVYYNETISELRNITSKISDTICAKLKSKNYSKLCTLFSKTFSNTLTDAIQLLHDGTVYAITGDIPLMWLRDSAAQVSSIHVLNLFIYLVIYFFKYTFLFLTCFVLLCFVLNRCLYL